MNRAQAAAFLIGLNGLEKDYPKHLIKYGGFKYCVFIFRHDIVHNIDLKPLGGIEREAILWDEIKALFFDSTSFKISLK